MLPLRDEGEFRRADYWQRVGVLKKHGILTPPSNGGTAYPQLLKRDELVELSYALFVGWLFDGVLNDRSQPSEGFRVAYAPLKTRSAFVLSKTRTPLSPVGRGKRGMVLDTDALACPVDEGATVDRSSQIYCPVLNRLRLNLGTVLRDTLNTAPNKLKTPDKSEECCTKGKIPLWQFLELADERSNRNNAHDYAWALGGRAIVLDVIPEVLHAYLGNTDVEKLGGLFEETLMMLAQCAAKTFMGTAHFAITKPFESNEIDFAIWSLPATERNEPAEPPQDWKQYVSTHGLCAFELTAGHIGDKSAKQAKTQAKRKKAKPSANEPDIDEATRTGLRPKASDHAHKKLVNYLALKSLGMKTLRFIYISILGLDSPGRANATALRGTQGFEYWCLADDVPNIDQLILNHYDAPISDNTLRDWHSRIVAKVEEAACKFAAAQPDG